jgi:hypothetical protein
MGMKDSYPVLVVRGLKTDTASTDGTAITVPYTGKGYAVRRVTVYDSRIGSTGATANGATATLGLFTGAGGTGVTIVADAALTGLTGNTVVLDRTVAATALTPKVTTNTIYPRVGTASGVSGSVIDLCIEFSVLP